MPSATDFLPSSITDFMNFDRVRSPNFGSGRISRFSGRRRRDIGWFLSLQPVPGLQLARGLLSFFFRHSREGGNPFSLLDPGLRRGSSTLRSATWDAWRRIWSATDAGP